MQTLPAAALEYLSGCQDELVELIKTLCRIPAPSNFEEQRAAFCKDWFEKAGARDVYIDDALNVVCPIGYTPGGQVDIYMAHTDTVFPDMTPFEPVVDGDRLCCPGVGDDTTNLAMLMLCARYYLQNKVPCKNGVLFVANAGEEGLGNLKGCRQLMKDYEGQVLSVISFDGGLGFICNDAVGSDRYKVTLTAQGGHSFGKFGNSNAIHLLSCLIAELYEIKPIQVGKSKTTYNVGMISGGTSVNSIAQTAEMLYEYRSDNRECLAYMESQFRQLVEKYTARAEKLEVEILGQRPCMGDVDPKRQSALEQQAAAIMQAVTGKAPGFGPGSTDCNIPFSLGIPGLCTGGYIGDGAHRREEWVDMSSFGQGMQVIMGITALSFNL